MTTRSAMFALAAVLASPGLALAQNAATAPARTTPPATAPMAATTPAPMTANGALVGNRATTPAAQAEYKTADDMLRASKIIGSSVYNDQDQKIGSVSELLIANGHDVNSVVLSVGGFLGIDAKLVKVSYTNLQVQGDKLVMSGATKDQLKQMPTYKYNAAG